MPSSALPSEINKLLRRQHVIPGTNVPAYRLLDILAMADGDVAQLIVTFPGMNAPTMRKAFHDMAMLFRALEKQYLGPPVAATKPVKSALVRDAEAVKAADEIKVFVDGACKGNPGPRGIGYVIADAQGKSLYEHRAAIGTGTNNEAEYGALIAAMEKVLSLGKRKARFFSDSELLVHQVMGRWKIKKRELALLCGQATKLRAQFEDFRLAAIPREQNKRADYLASSTVEKDAGDEAPAAAPESP